MGNLIVISKQKTGSVVNVVESPPSHLVRPNVAAVEVGVSCPGVDGVLVKVFGNIFGCCLWEQPVNTLPVKKKKKKQVVSKALY